MVTREITEALSFDENEVKQVLMDTFCNDEEEYIDWEIVIDIGKTPAIITIKKHKAELIL